jgi:ribosomal protein L37AE/L43A
MKIKIKPSDLQKCDKCHKVHFVLISNSITYDWFCEKCYKLVFKDTMQTPVNIPDSVDLKEKEEL